LYGQNREALFITAFGCDRATTTPRSQSQVKATLTDDNKVIFQFIYYNR